MPAAFQISQPADIVNYAGDEPSGQRSSDELSVVLPDVSHESLIDTSTWLRWRDEGRGIQFLYPPERHVEHVELERGRFSGKRKLAVRSTISQQIEKSSKGDLSDEIAVLVFDSIQEINGYFGTSFSSLEEYLGSGLAGIPSALRERETKNGYTNYEIRESGLNERLSSWVEVGPEIVEFVVVHEPSFDEYRALVDSFAMGATTQ